MATALYYELIVIFSLGYLGIIFERFIHINKAAIAILMAVCCWLVFYAHTQGLTITKETFNDYISNEAQIIFFLLAAMVIVELIDSHHGFKIITDIIYTSSKIRMLWFLIFISFFMSAVLDNLTAMIVMTSLLRKMFRNRKDRWLYGSIIVIAVNAGGAWTPIGDVTTTLLWINDKITTWAIIKSLFLPSAVCIGVSGLLAGIYLRGKEKVETILTHAPLEPGARTVLFTGVLMLVLIPVWKGFLNLPPFMGALIGLGVLWVMTDLMHFRHPETRRHLRVHHVLTRIDTSGVLFFLGILLAINALETPGILRDFANFLERTLPNQNFVAFFIGLVSSVIDNVPLVAATMGMYDMQTFPTDSTLWQLIAYAAGTGGSILIIGSAAGVAFMGLEKVDFLWYFRYIAWIALVGYTAGFLIYFLQAYLIS